MRKFAKWIDEPKYIAAYVFKGCLIAVIKIPLVAFILYTGIFLVNQIFNPEPWTTLLVLFFSVVLMFVAVLLLALLPGTLSLAIIISRQLRIKYSD